MITFKEALDEMPRINNIGADSASKLRPEKDIKKIGSYKLPSGEEREVSERRGEDGSHKFYGMNKNEEGVKLSTYKSEDEHTGEEYHHVSDVFSTGGEHAHLLYKHLLMNGHVKEFRSGNQSEGARKHIWKKLHADPDIDVFNRDSDDGKIRGFSNFKDMYGRDEKYNQMCAKKSIGSETHD